MEILRSVKIKTSFSFAVCLIDSYTSAPVIGRDFIVSIVGLHVKPIAKANGYYVFTDLPNQNYQVQIQSRFYVQDNIEVPLALLESNEPILYVPLMPNAQYPFGQDATSLVALLKDHQGNPASQIKAKATVTSLECVKAKLLYDSPSNGADQIYLTQIMGKLTIGDRFFIQSDTGAAEDCRLIKMDEGTRCYSLEQPLQFSYEKGSRLYPIIESQSDAKGELLLFFKPSRTPKFGITLEFIYGNEKHSQEIQMEQGTTKSLGIIRLVN